MTKLHPTIDRIIERHTAKADFRVEDHGTIWIVTAKTPAAIAAFEDLNYADVIYGDWRPTWRACQELHGQGFSFNCTTVTAQKLIETGEPW